MTHVIVSPCVGLKEGSCIDVCPVDCIYTTDDDNQMYIEPDECIDCGACVPACPVTAIFLEDRVPADERQYLEINVKYFEGKDMADLKLATKTAKRMINE
ncbi:MAG: ferredoxin family protein [SAR202 cluster bacterium]|mgnify:FL=1|jgi:NAD-dependent dihydropyrimidine dehydrogenase PreA subunit|nr:ferredoxin family protein [SAR202 cluster bacterium]|tara:strand:+ start:477 stop:776 length:300 start_codon:yes stop_codon:yes gene_type:complete